MEFLISTAFVIGIAVILATSFNLIIGYAGLMSIAHPIFMALGAYGSSLLVKDGGLPFPVGLLGGMLIAGVASLAVSLPSLRVSGDYLVVASIGFQLGVLQIIKNLDFTGGPGGLSGIAPLLPDQSDADRWACVGIVWALALGTIFLVRWLVCGPFGRAITAMRDDEEAFVALGRSAMTIKVTLFAIACVLAGLAGGLYAHFYQYVSPDQFDIVASASILTMVVVGGLRTVWGPMCGALLLQILPQAILFLNMPSSVTGPLQGILFTGLVLVFLFSRPAGLIGSQRAPRAEAMPVQEGLTP